MTDEEHRPRARRAMINPGILLSHRDPKLYRRIVILAKRSTFLRDWWD